MNRLATVAVIGMLAIDAAAARAQPSSPAPAAPCPTHRCAETLLGVRTLRAERITGAPPVIDGRLDEETWSKAPIASRLVQTVPDAGAEATLRTEARVLYDDHALYVGIRLFDPEPRTIVAPLVRRDDETTCDWTFVEIDSRHDRRSALSFGLNPRGVQADGMWLNDTSYDASWDGVWAGAAAIDSEGWTAEFRIPFSQLPYEALNPQEGRARRARERSGASDNARAERSEPGFGAEPRLEWGVNIYRYSPHHGESADWSPRLPWQNGIVSHFNLLTLEPPPRAARTELQPFTLLQQEHEPAGPIGDASRLLAREGLDARFGLGSAFTLSGSVLPDFGQVEADPSQLNLTAFELFQPEQRPLFVQGMDAFRIDTSLNFVTRDDSFRDESPFYSRRIGRAPRGSVRGGAAVESAPSATRILGAAKLSGQTAGGWTIGALSATTRRAEVRVESDAGRLSSQTIEPTSQVELLRVAKLFREGDAGVGTFFTSTTHPGLEESTAARFVRQAWSAGADARERFRGGRYEVRGWFAASHLAGTEAAIAAVEQQSTHDFQRPDGDRVALVGTTRTLSGFAGQTSLARIGDHLRWTVSAEAVSPGFDVNELGFQRNTDWLLLTASWQYERFTTNPLIRHWIVGSDNGGQAGASGIGWNWAGDPRARTLGGFAQLDTTSYWTVSADWLHDFPALSTDWLRGGPALLAPTRDTWHASVISDQRRPSFAQVDGLFVEEPGSGSYAWEINPQFDYRSATHVHGALGVMWQQDTRGWQDVAEAPAEGTPLRIVARDRQQALALTLRAEYTFTPHLSLQFYAQPFATTGRYDRYKVLRDPRAADIGRRFLDIPTAAVFHPALSTTAFDVDADGRTDVSFATPDGLERDLNADAVLRWEYRPGSFLTAVWNRHSERLFSSTSEALNLGGLRGDPSTNVFLVKLTYYVSV
jgi:hypothetical protein